MASRREQPEDESGAILILALVFLVAVSLIVVSLLSWSGASLLSTTAFGNERSVEYAATSAVDLAIQNTRYSYDSQFLTNTAPQPCLGSGVTPPTFTEGVNGTTVQETIDVYCTMTWDPSSSETRIITYSACPTTDNFTASQCAQTPLLQAVVSFNDYAGITSPPPDCDSPINDSSCGLTMAQLSWTWRPVAPAISSLTNGSGPINGGTTPTLQINGTGFVSGSTVNFIEESGGTPSTSLQGFFSNLPTASSATCQAPTCLLVTPPAITEGVGYYVTVTTPATGTSLETGSAIYTYAPILPTLTSISGSIPAGQPYVGGSITGGTVVTITGTGFVKGTNPPTVNFICVSGCTPGAVYPASPTLVDVQSDTTMTAVSPNQLTSPSPGTYYVQVINVLGSAGSSSNTNDLYDYTTQVPIVTNLSSITGTAGSTITVSGGNFLSASSVTFYEESSGNEVTPVQSVVGTNVTNVTATTLTVTTPATVQAATTYFVVVSWTLNGTTYTSQTYNVTSSNPDGDVYTFTNT